jgi:CBS domain containing-hemolysin-like protein
VQENSAIIVISLLLSGFFSGTEIAFISVDKLLIEIDREKGKIGGRIISRFLRHPSQFLGTLLVGNNIVNVVYGIFMANLFEPILANNLPELINNPTTIFLSQTILATLVVLITAEFIPKSIFYINPHSFLTILAVPILIIYSILYPLVYIIVGFSKFVITRIFRLEFKEDTPVFGLTDLNNFIQNRLNEKNRASLLELDTTILSNALEFKTVKVRECMIPRTDLRAVDVNDGIDVLKKEFIDSGYSKILVYRDSIDEIIGYCHTLAMFRRPKNIDAILTPIMIVPETMPANELLVQFITERKNISLVVDEFGGTSGIVTLEDIMEEIFGEIEDEHDEQGYIDQMLDESNYLLSARLEIDFLNEKYGLGIPEGDYDTLGGYILSITRDMPSVNEDIMNENLVFHIISRDENKINLVKLTKRD